MRASLLAAIPLFTALSAVPAAGQVSARLHVEVPIGRRLPVGYSVGHRPIIVREYDPYRYGAWNNSFDQWVPRTVYLYDGNYYDYPVVAYAEPIVVYGYRNELFFAPRQREFIQWRAQERYRDIGRAYRSVPRYDHFDRHFPAPRTERQYRPAPNSGRDGREMRPAPQGGRTNAPDRGGDRSRPRGR